VAGLDECPKEQHGRPGEESGCGRYPAERANKDKEGNREEQKMPHGPDCKMPTPERKRSNISRAGVAKRYEERKRTDQETRRKSKRRFANHFGIAFCVYKRVKKRLSIKTPGIKYEIHDWEKINPRVPRQHPRKIMSRRRVRRGSVSEREALLRLPLGNRNSIKNAAGKRQAKWIINCLNLIGHKRAETTDTYEKNLQPGKGRAQI